MYEQVDREDNQLFNVITDFAQVHDNLPSHKIRFTGDSMLYDAGVKPINIQPLLGHSTLTMTQHYIGQRVVERYFSNGKNIFCVGLKKI